MGRIWIKGDLLETLSPYKANNTNNYAGAAMSETRTRTRRTGLIKRERKHDRLNGDSLPKSPYLIDHRLLCAHKLV